MMHTRRVLGVAAATATVMGLLLPTQPASATNTCVFDTPPTTKVLSLTGSCTIDATLHVDDGWTVDGNGFTMTADPAGFTGGAVITNTAGTSGQPATSMTVAHLAIANVPSGVDGILFDGAKGHATQVTITGGQNGVEIENTVGTTFAPLVPTDQVKVEHQSSIGGYQKAAVHVTDGMRFTVIGSTIGDPSGGTLAAGIFVEGLAHGAITENHIHLAHAASASPTDYRAGVKLEGTLRVEVKRNEFRGADADFAVSVNDLGGAKRTTAAVDCDLFTLTGSASQPYGVAVGQWTTGHSTNVQVTNATFKGGWNNNTGIVNGSTVNPGVPNVHDGHCPPGAPRHVRAHGRDHKIKVTWRTAIAPFYAPLTDYRIKAKAKGHRAVTKTVGPNATSARIKGLKNNRRYVVTVTARSNGGKASATDSARTSG